MRTWLRAIWDVLRSTLGCRGGGFSVTEEIRRQRKRMVDGGDLTAEVVAAYMELLREQRRLQFDGQPIVNRIIYTTNRTGEGEETVRVPDTFPEEWAE